MSEAVYFAFAAAGVGLFSFCVGFLFGIWCGIEAQKNAQKRVEQERAGKAL